MSDVDEYDTSEAVSDEGDKELELPPASEVPVSPTTSVRRRKSRPQRYTVKMARRALQPETAEEGQKQRRKYRHRPGVVALREIRKYQTTTGMLIEKAPFRRLLKDITEELRPGIRWQKEAVEAIQESAESMLIELFTNSNTYTAAAKRQTLEPIDFRLAVQSKFGESSTMDLRKLYKK